MKRQTYSIAGHKIAVEYVGLDTDFVVLAPSFQPFVVDNVADADAVLSVKVDDSFRPDGRGLTKVGDYPTDDITYALYIGESGALVVTIADAAKRPLGVFEISADFDRATIAILAQAQDRVFAFSNAMMVAYLMATCARGTLIIHSSTVVRDGCAYMFLGKSGTGKSTHSRLWLDNVPNTRLLNDDNPIIRITDDGKAMAYGSPWSGKTPCYKQESAQIGALVSLHQAKENKIAALSDVPAFVELLTSVSTLICHRPCYDEILKSVIRLAETVPVYSLNCLPDSDAAVLCSNTVCK